MAAVNHLKPDLAVADLSLQDGSGMDLIKNLKALHPKLPVLVLSVHDENLYAERAVRAGALGYVMKSHDSTILLRAICPKPPRPDPCRRRVGEGKLTELTAGLPAALPSQTASSRLLPILDSHQR